MVRVRRACQLFGLGFCADDVPALHVHWREQGSRLPQVAHWRLKDTPADAPPIFAFQEIPPSLLPGAVCFALSSRFPNARMRRQAWVAPNGSYAISGLSFVSEDPVLHASRWHAVLEQGGWGC